MLDAMGVLKVRINILSLIIESPKAGVVIVQGLELEIKAHMEK